MNPSELSSRSSRKIEIGGDIVALHHEESRQRVPPASSTLSPATPEPLAETAGHADLSPLDTSIPAMEPDTHRLAADVAHLRQALARLLARETGQDTAIFESPAVSNARLCAIADNICHDRHWAA